VVDYAQIDTGSVDEVGGNLLTLTLPKESMIYKDTDQLISHAHERARCNSRINATRSQNMRDDRQSSADVAIFRQIPLVVQMGAGLHLDEKALNQLLAVCGVKDLWMPLHPNRRPA